MPTYAGIGARRSPPEILAMMRMAGRELAARGWTLRTGGAAGADQAFLEGAIAAGGPVELYLPWSRFVDGAVRANLPPNVVVFEFPTRAAHDLAARYRHNWKNLRRGVQALMARNVHQVLGYDLDSPARLVLCWTPNGESGGGTGQAIRIATDQSIPVADLGRADSRRRLQGFLTDRVLMEQMGGRA